MITSITLEGSRNTVFAPFANNETYSCLNYLIRPQTASPG